MKVSLNTVKQYIDFELPPVDELVERINEQLGGVEEVIDLGAKYKDAKIVKVVECEKHPNADRLSICKIDDGSGGLVQVVCGAPNVKSGMWAVWLLPESIVPSTHGSDDEFKLGARELRGVMSHGMLAAADELAIGSDHDGILEIDPEEWKPSGVEIKPGASFAKVYGLDDTIIDIENKMFTHRPDLFGQLGVAREIAGILGHKFTSPSWYLDKPKFENGKGLTLDVFNDAGDKVPRLMFAAMKNVAIKPSPLWLQTALVAMGSKPINNIVDVTNYVMLLTAQPTHAYDYDKLRGHKIGARMAKTGEKLTLLNGKTYELSEDDIVIADDEGAIGLGGIMGGGNSEVSAETQNIVLEVATFDMYAVRKSSMRHGIFTDALTRFNKGQSPLQNDHIMNLLAMSIKDVSSAESASEVFDEKLARDEKNPAVSVNQKFINDRLGLQLSVGETKTLLENVEINVEGEFEITPPFWRTDIELPEDIVEEVGRLYGFDKLPRELPLRSAKPTPKNNARELKQAIRKSLAKSGANEVLTYSFVHENVMKKAEQDASQAFRLSNALSPDLQYYRLNVLPSLLDKVHINIKAGYDEFTLFEIGKGHNKKYHSDDDEGLPSELEFVDMVYARKQPKTGAAYYALRRQLDQLANDLALGELVYKAVDETLDYPVTAPFDLTRSALIETADGTFLGLIGELKPPVITNFKLPRTVAAMTLDFNSLMNARRTAKGSYRPLSRYPSVTQDISLKIATEIPYKTLVDVAQKSVAEKISEDTQVTIEPVSIYQAEDDNDSKTISLRLKVANYQKTLRDSDVSSLLDTIAQVTAEKLNAKKV